MKKDKRISVECTSDVRVFDSACIGMVVIYTPICEFHVDIRKSLSTHVLYAIARGTFSNNKDKELESIALTSWHIDLAERIRSSGVL